MANLDPYVVGNASKNIGGCVLVTHPTMSPQKVIAANLVHKKASKLSPSNSSAYDIQCMNHSPPRSPPLPQVGGCGTSPASLREKGGRKSPKLINKGIWHGGNSHT